MYVGMLVGKNFCLIFKQNSSICGWTMNVDPWSVVNSDYYFRPRHSWVMDIVFELCDVCGIWFDRNKEWKI